VAIATTLVVHNAAYYHARDLRSKNPDAISTTHLWTSQIGYAGSATEKEVYEDQRRRGSWNSGRDALLMDIVGPLGANVAGLAVLLIWATMWPPPLLRIGAVTILPVYVPKTSMDWSADRSRELDAKLSNMIRTSTGLRVLNSPDMPKAKDGAIPWQVYRDLGVDMVLAVEITFGPHQTITGHVHLIGVDTGQLLWSKEFLLDDQSIDRKVASDVGERMDEFANLVVRGLRSKLVRE
jgi:hypothetical protein